MTSHQRRVEVLAHRGFSGVAPENTAAAFEAAAALGVGIELDVGLCRSGEVVVCHDETVDRTTGGTGLVTELDLSALRALDAGSWFHERFAGQRIPTLDEVLTLDVPRFDVEIKPVRAGRRQVAHAVVAAVERAGVAERTLITSFDPLILGLVRRRNPSIRRGQLTGTFEHQDKMGRFQKTALRKLWLNRVSRPHVIAIEHLRASARVVRRLHERGYEVYAWTVNDPAEMAALIGRGIDGLITDRPDLALALVSG